MTQSTPSSILWLHAGAWAGPAATSGDETAAQQVAEMLLATAFLANEQARGMELELHAEHGLVLHPGDDVPDWPANSLEHQIWLQMALGQTCVSDIVYDLLKETPTPGQLVVQYVAASPAAAESPLDPVSGMLRRVSEEQAALWAELFAEIRIGLDLCRK